MLIKGKNIDLRKVTVDDAKFILSLRLDTELSRYLHPTEDSLKKQQEWIKNSLHDKKQFYFIIQNKKKIPLGTIRIHDISGNNFQWGSWIVKPAARSYSSFESVVLMYEYAFFCLKLSTANLHAKKENTKAVNFHLRFGSNVDKEDEENFYFSFSKEIYILLREKYQHIISCKEI